MRWRESGWRVVMRHLFTAAAASAVLFFALSPFILVEPVNALGDITANRQIVVDRAVHVGRLCAGPALPRDPVDGLARPGDRGAGRGWSRLDAGHRPVARNPAAPVPGDVLCVHRQYRSGVALPESRRAFRRPVRSLDAAAACADVSGAGRRVLDRRCRLCRAGAGRQRPHRTVFSYGRYPCAGRALHRRAHSRGSYPPRPAIFGQCSRRRERRSWRP